MYRHYLPDTIHQPTSDLLSSALLEHPYPAHTTYRLHWVLRALEALLIRGPSCDHSITLVSKYNYCSVPMLPCYPSTIGITRNQTKWGLSQCKSIMICTFVMCSTNEAAMILLALLMYRKACRSAGGPPVPCVLSVIPENGELCHILSWSPTDSFFQIKHDFLIKLIAKETHLDRCLRCLWLLPSSLSVISGH